MRDEKGGEGAERDVHTKFVAGLDQAQNELLEPRELPRARDGYGWAVGEWRDVDLQY